MDNDAARPHDQDSRTLIEPYLGRTVVSQLDGVMFDDEPNQFTFRFADPAKLRDQIAEDFTDEMDMEPWAELVPVAAISVPAREDREFAWVFLDWREGGPPHIVIATHDNWSADPHMVASGGLAAVGL